MRGLIITVAGMATRFSESVGYKCIKCLYYENKFEDSILARLLKCSFENFDYIVLVGGFNYEQLEDAIKKYYPDKQNQIVLVKNEFFKEYGSGYSLYVGLLEAFKRGAKEIVFAEGDLYVKPEDLKTIYSTNKDVITANCEPIFAKKAVAFYTDTSEKIHYIYDTAHNALSIDEPFLSIRNSGQIWKFSDGNRLKQIVDSLNEEEKQGTNLVIVQKYFETLSNDEYQIITFKDWINCNTVEDFRKIHELEGE